MIRSRYPRQRSSCFLVRSLIVLCALCGFAKGAEPVSFRRDVAPILLRKCVSCHAEDNVKGGYRMDTFERLLNAGDSGEPPVSPGNPERSELYRLLLEESPTDRMPRKSDPLPSAQIELIGRWITEGAICEPADQGKALVELTREQWLRPAPRQYPHALPLSALAFSPDASRILVSGYHEITLWDVASARLVKRFGGLPEKIHGLAWHRQRNLVAVAGGAGSQWGGIFLLDPTGDAPPEVLCDLPDTGLAVAFSPDGKWLAACGGDRFIRIIDVDKRKVHRTFRQHADLVHSVAFDSTGNRLVSASRDRTARVFDFFSGEVTASYAGHEAPVLGAAFSHDDRFVYSVARRQAAHVWTTLTGTLRRPLAAAGREVQVVAANPGGILTGGTDAQVQLSGADDLKPIFQFSGHADCINTMAVHTSAREGIRIATGSHEGIVCIWSLQCGTWIQRFAAKPQ